MIGTAARDHGVVGVIGARGTNAALWTHALLGAGFEVRTLTRDPQRVAPAPGRHAVKLDFDAIDATSDALAGLATLCLVTPAGPKQVDIETALIAAARRAGIERIIKLSVLGADLATPVSLFARSARAVENVLAGCGARYVILRANSFMQNLLAQREAIAKGRLVQPKGLGAVSHLDVADIAEIAAAAATGRLDGETLDLTGPQALTGEDLRDALTRASGHPVDLVEQDAEALREVWLAAGMPAWRVDALTELNANVVAGRAPHLSRVTDAVERALGRKPASFASFAAREFGPPAGNELWAVDCNQ